MKEEEVMDIPNITMQANTIEFPSPPAKVENTANVSGQSSSAQVSSQSSTITPQGQMLSIRSHIDFIQQQLDVLMDNDPPFFPAGSPQRVDLIKGFQWVQKKIENSAIPADIKQGLSNTKLSDNASNSDIMAALNNLIQINNSIKQKSTEGAATIDKGTVVSTKI